MTRSLIRGAVIPCPGTRSWGVERDVSEDLPSDDLKGTVAGTALLHPQQPNREVRDTLRYVGRGELRELFPVSDMTIFRWTHDSRVAFPRPVKLGPSGRNFWRLAEILEWERRRAASSLAKGDE